MFSIYTFRDGITTEPVIPVEDLAHPEVVATRIKYIAGGESGPGATGDAVRRSYALRLDLVEEYLSAMLLLWARKPYYTAYGTAQSKRAYRTLFRFQRMTYPVPEVYSGLNQPRKDYLTLIPRIEHTRPKSDSRGKPRMSVSSMLIEGYEEAVFAWAKQRGIPYDQEVADANA